jgi:hypothetical protein
MPPSFSNNKNEPNNSSQTNPKPNSSQPTNIQQNDPGSSVNQAIPQASNTQNISQTQAQVQSQPSKPAQAEVPKAATNDSGFVGSGLSNNSNVINKTDSVPKQMSTEQTQSVPTMRDFYSQNKNQFVNYGASSNANGSTNIPTMNKSPFTPRNQNINENPVSHKKSPIVSLVILVVVLAVAGLVYAYKDTLMDKFVSKTPLSAGKIFSVIKNSAKDIKRATYTINIKISGSESTSVNTTDDTNALQNSPLVGISLLPSSFKLDATVTGNSAKDEKGSINSKIGLVGMVDFGSLKADVSLSYLMIDKDMYINIDKIPQILGDTSKIQGKWIHVNMKDIGSKYGLSFDKSDKNIDSPEYRKSNELLISLLDKNNVVDIVGSPVREKIGEFSTYRYDLTLNQQGVTQFLKDVEQNKDTILFTQDMRDSFDRFMKTQDPAQISKVIDYIKKNGSVMIWVTKEGMPIQMKLSFKLDTPQVRNTKGKQFIFDFTMTLSDLNKAIDISAPSSFIEEDDAYSLLTGKSKDVIVFEKQYSNISYVPYILEAEFMKNKRYPDVLPESIKSDNIKSYKTLNNGSAFKLVYDIKLPVYTQNQNIQSYLKMNYGSGSSLLYGLKVVDGMNTMDHTSLSLEADAQNKIDSDKDGLSDALERYIGTNPMKKDPNVKSIISGLR